MNLDDFVHEISQWDPIERLTNMICLAMYVRPWKCELYVLLLKVLDNPLFHKVPLEPQYYQEHPVVISRFAYTVAEKLDILTSHGPDVSQYQKYIGYAIDTREIMTNCRHRLRDWEQYKKERLTGSVIFDVMNDAPDAVLAHPATNLDEMKSWQFFRLGSAYRSGGTPLVSLAAYFGSIECLKALINRGDAVDGNALPLSFARGRQDVISLLMQHKTRLDGCLAMAATYHQNALVRWLVDTKEVNVNNDKYCHCDALNLAARTNNLTAMSFLITRNASNRSRDRCDRTPLHRACESCCVEAGEFLIAHNANLDATMGWSDTPLIRLQYCHSRILKEVMTVQLVDAGADFTATNDYGAAANIPQWYIDAHPEMNIEEKLSEAYTAWETENL